MAKAALNRPNTGIFRAPRAEAMRHGRRRTIVASRRAMTAGRSGSCAVNRADFSLDRANLSACGRGGGIANAHADHGNLCHYPDQRRDHQQESALSCRASQQILPLEPYLQSVIGL